MMSNAIRRGVLLLRFVLSAGAAFAQKSTGEIKGAVLDPSNASVPKATVTAKDLATGLTYTAIAGEDGSYLIPKRPTLQAEALDFLNHPVFGFGTLNINSTSFGQLSSSRVGARNIQIRAYLRW